MLFGHKKTVGANYYWHQFNWQLQHVKLANYCKVCFWANSNDYYKFCPYGHGAMTSMDEYLLADL